MKPKQLINLNSVSLIFGTEDSCDTDIKLEVKGRYQYCLEGDDHTHTESCWYSVKEYSLGIVEVKKGKVSYTDIAGDNVDPSQLTLESGGILNFDITEVYGGPIQLSAFRSGGDTWVDRYQVAPSEMFKGSLFKYRNDGSEFLEITFNIVEGHINTKLMFALYDVDFSVEE